MRRGYATTPEGQIHYYEHGRGAPLLMLHESPRAAWSFAPLMERMGARFQCVAPDTPGFGMSDPPAAGAGMEDLAQTFIHFMDAQGIRRAHVLGFHTGNKVGAAMAAHWPDRVDRLVLIGMTHSMVVSRKARNAAIMNIVRKYMNQPPDSADGSHLLRQWASDFRDVNNAWWSPAVLSGSAQITAKLLRGQADRAVEMIQCRDAIRQVYQMNFDYDFAGTLRKVRAPTQVIECRVPEEAHLGAQGPLMVKLMKQSELVTLDGAGFDATEAFAAQIARAAGRFLGGTARERAS